MSEITTRDYTMLEQASQLSEYGEIEGLKDERYPWRTKKLKNIRLAKLYEKSGWEDYAERARTCATWLQYYSDGENRELKAANFCNLRLCPMCIGRRARRAAYKLSQVLDLTEREKGAKFIFLTLTIRNVPGKELGDAVGQLLKAWYRLMEQRQVERSIRGWFRALEITRNNKPGKWYGTYHPHIHAILAVEPRYFYSNSPLYLTKDNWITRWQKALRVDYRPTVYVEVTKAKETEDYKQIMQASAASAKEAAKYCVKDEDYIDPSLTDRQAAFIVSTYTKALRRRRLTAYGGWLLDAARRLDADDLDNGDLVHADEQILREDVAELIEEYHWNFGAGDYILTDRRPNPLRAAGGANPGDAAQRDSARPRDGESTPQGGSTAGA